ncbi:sugar transferase [Pedococcus sp. 5OH_020]|uniref:sugar transferase n=1 Tax=Pedococcus sp. 5OH_020 TaxID=2989814 RepID=UPI0022EA0412|nr:sugar transferase [Pedococcus sp. 5OH_020]
MTPDRSQRVLDLAIALPAAVLSLPVQALLAVLVRWRLGRPVLFRQTRPGLHGEPFQLLKFRTMRPLDPQGSAATDAARLTEFGRLLRSSSLDELPSLWNVVRGEMSLVGPRPLLMQYLDRYSPEQARRHEVRPGLTGLAQVSGRNSLSWEEKFRLDVQYVDTRSTLLDLRILARTVLQVLTRAGISMEGHVTAPEFLGSLSDEDPR